MDLYLQVSLASSKLLTKAYSTSFSLGIRTLDEKVVAELLADKNNRQYPDAVVLVADATNLKNCLLLLTQLMDLKLPTVLPPTILLL